MDTTSNLFAMRLNPELHISTLVRRLVLASDFEQVFALYMHEASIPYLGFDPMSKSAFAAVFATFVASGTFSVFAANDAASGDDILGFINVVRLPGRSSHVVRLGPIAVRAALHGSGIARSMMSIVLREARSAGIRRVELAVETDNPRAIGFYRHFGFEIEGTLRQAYRRLQQDHDVDSHIMALLYA